jgi:hypothetical protein
VPKTTDLEGTWSEGEIQLTLSEDMAAELVNVPGQLFGQPPSETISTSGTWSFGFLGKSYGSDGAPVIGVTVQVGKVSTETAFSYRDGSTPVLYAYLGDPDSGNMVQLERD